MLALSGACKSGPTTGQVQGVLVDVQSRSIADADSITVRDQSGVTRTFRVSDRVARDPEHPTNASHLRLHMAMGLPVIVEYEDAPEGPLAVRVADASPASF